MDIQKKEELIRRLNINYLTILSYGNDGLIPNGEFIVEDILIEENENNSKESAKIVLRNKKDESIKLVIPSNVFFKEYLQFAEANADLLGTGSDLAYSEEELIKRVEYEIYKDDTLTLLQDPHLLDLAENNIEYSDSNGVKSDNYSICPLDLGKYREKILTREKKDEEMIR